MHSMWVSWNRDLSDVLRLHAFVCLFVYERKELWQMSAEAACHLAFRQNQAFFFFSKGVLLHICLCTSTKMFMYFYKYMLTTQRQISFETNIWLRLFPLLWGNFHMAILSLTSCQSLSLRSKTALFSLRLVTFELFTLVQNRTTISGTARETSIMYQGERFIQFYNCLQSSPILGRGWANKCFGKLGFSLLMTQCSVWWVRGRLWHSSYCVLLWCT